MMIDSMVMFCGYRRVPKDQLEQTVRYDNYRLILAEMLKLGLLGEAHLVLRCEREDHHQLDGVRVHMVRTYASLPAECTRGEVLFVRGDKNPYLPALRAGKWKAWLFYAASRHFFPRRTWGYDAILADEPEHLALIEKHFPKVLARRFVKTADPAIFHPLRGEAKQYDVCCLGNMDSRPKNYAALPAIVRKLPQLQYVIVGRTHRRLTEQLLAISPNVHLTGFLSHPEVNRILNRSRVGLILSEHDGAPRTILEAMASGLPQVVNERLACGKCYITTRAGIIAPLEGFPQAIMHILKQSDDFDPAGEFLSNFSPRHAASAVARAAADALSVAGVHRPRWKQRLMNTAVISAINARRLRKLAEKLCG